METFQKVFNRLEHIYERIEVGTDAVKRLRYLDVIKTGI